MTKELIALLVSIPFIVQVPTMNTKQIKAEIQTKQEGSMDTLYSNNLLIKQLEAKEKEYKEQQRKLAEEKRLKEIEEQKKKTANVPQYVLNRGGSYRKVRLRVSYYTVNSQCCDNTLGITASGKKIRDGFIATPPNIPFGTQMYFNGRIYTVEDRGGAITMNNGVMDVDVYVPGATNKQLMNLGVKYVDGWILE